MNEIKIYEELSYIHTFDDKVYPTPLTLNVINKMLENSKFLNLGSDLINVSNIKRVESKKVDSVENSILQIKDTELREKVMNEVKKRKAE
jgi:UDP-galactopyranose mutase